MSTTIDEKIVSMKFDNSNFERNVKDSMSTIDKLKAKLNFKGASDGLDDLSKASEKLTFKETQNGLEKVSVQFSAMYAIATRIFDRLTDQAIGLIKSMSVDQLTAGWSKYADKTESVQTIMAATGESIEVVNEQLDNLAWFTDETSYNFTDMVSNIGKFTAAGVDLETAVTAMEGIANWAAISGQNANAASRAMYNLAQSMGAGYVTLMDWKSIELANMGTKAFKEQALETAAALGVLAEQGKDADGVMQYIIRETGELVSYKNFRETLSDKWLTNDVLMVVLNEYGAYASAVQTVMDRLDIDTASKTMQYIDQMFSKNHYSAEESGLLEIAETFNLTIEEAQALYDTYNSVGRQAFKAAQEAKTFAEAVGATKDAVSSYWMQIFETIFGDYQEAKILFTDLANEMWDVFAGPLEALNDELTASFNHKSDWYDFIELLELGGYSAEEFEESLIKASGEITYTYKDTEYTLEGLISTFGSLEKVSENGFISFGLMQEAVSSMGGAAGILANNMDKVFAITEKGGRIKLIESIAKTYNYLKEVLGSIGAAWQNAFPISISERISRFIDRFYEFANGLELTEEQAESITNTFEGLFSLFRSVGSVISGVISSVYSIAKDIFPYVVGLFFKIGSYIGPFISAFAENIERVVSYFQEHISDWIDTFINSETVQSIKEYLGMIYSFFSDMVAKISNKINNADGKKIFEFFDKLVGIATGLVNSILSSKAFQDIGLFIAGVINNISDAINNFRLPSFSEISEAFKSFFNQFSGNKSIMDSLSKQSIEGFIEVIKSLFSIKVKKEKNNVINTLTTAYQETGSVLSKAISWALGFVHNISSFISRIVGISIKNVYTAIKNILVLAEMFAAFKLMMSFSGVLNAIRDKISGGQGGVGSILNGLANFIKTLGIVIAEMVALSIALGELRKRDPKIIEDGLKDLSNILFAIGILMGAAIVATMLPTVSEGKLNGIALMIISLGISFGFIADALKKIEDLKFNPEGMVAFLIAVGAMFAFVSKLSGINGIAAALPLVALASGLSMFLDVIVKYNNFDWEHNINGMLALIPMLALLIGTVKLMSGATNGMSVLGFVGMTLALKMIVGIVEDLGSMEPGVWLKGEAALLGMLAILSAYTIIVSLISNTSFGGKGINTKLSTFIGIIILLAGLCVAVAVLGKMDVPTLVKGVGSVAVLMAGIIGLLYVMGKVGKVNGLKILGSMTALIAIIAAVGVIYKYILADANYEHAGESLATMAVLLLELGVLALAANELGKIVNFGTLTKGLAAIGEVMAFVIAAVGIIDYILIEVSKVVSEETLKKAETISSLLGSILGAFVGGIIGGIAGGAIAATASFLPYVGDQLSLFGEKISGFLDFLSKVKDDDSSKMSNFMSSMSEMVSSLAELTKYKGKLDTIPEVGTKMREFMENLMQDNTFFAGLDSVKDEQVAAAKVIAEIMNALAPLAAEGGLASIVIGNKNISKVGNDLTQFGGSLCKFVNILQNGDDGGSGLPSGAENTVKEFSEIAEIVINLFNKLPSDGGVIEKFLVGTNSWYTVRNGLRDFTKSILELVSTISKEEVILDDNAKNKVTSFLEIAKTVIEGFETLPNTGGVVGWLAGEKDWSTISSGLSEFGKSIAEFISYVNNLDSDINYQAAIEKVKYMLNLAQIITESIQTENGSVRAKLQSMILEYVGTINTSIVTYSDNLRKSGSYIGDYLKDGALSNVASIAEEVVNRFTMNFSAQFEANEKVLNEIGKGASSKISGGMYTGFYSAGEYAASGLADGLNSYNSRVRVWNAASRLGQHAVDALNYSLSIYSPSRVFMKSGEYSAEGYVQGITNSLGSVSKATNEMGNRSIAGMNSAINRIGESLGSTNSFSNQPVIRPVLDLSDVSSGADQMRGILGDNYNLALSGSVTSRRLSNSIEIQNGGKTMADAIASLKDDFKTMTNEIMGMKIVMDSGAVVGSISSKMDKALGTISTYKGRGNTY